MKYIATALAALALTLPAKAEMHTYEFTAAVNQIGNVNKLSFEQSTMGVQAGSLISMNDRIVGRFSYDSNARMERGSLDNPPYNPASTDYFYHGAYASPTDFFTFTILPSGQTVSAGDPDALTRRVTLADGKVGTPNSRDSLSIDTDGYDMSFGIDFGNATSTWISNGTLPQQLSLADMTSASVYHYFYRTDGSRIMLSGAVTSLTDITVTPVPEPGTWAMLLAGLSILGFTARRKRA